MSNFYLNISNYLNPKFKFNLSLASENFYLINNAEDSKNQQSTAESMPSVGLEVQI